MFREHGTTVSHGPSPEALAEYTRGIKELGQELQQDLTARSKAILFNIMTGCGSRTAGALLFRTVEALKRFESIAARLPAGENEQAAPGAPENLLQEAIVEAVIFHTGFMLLKNKPYSQYIIPQEEFFDEMMEGPAYLINNALEKGRRLGIVDGTTYELVREELSRPSALSSGVARTHGSPKPPKHYRQDDIPVVQQAMSHLKDFCENLEKSKPYLTELAVHYDYLAHHPADEAEEEYKSKKTQCDQLMEQFNLFWIKYADTLTGVAQADESFWPDLCADAGALYKRLKESRHIWNNGLSCINIATATTSITIHTKQDTPELDETLICKAPPQEAIENGPRFLRSAAQALQDLGKALFPDKQLSDESSQAYAAVLNNHAATGITLLPEDLVNEDSVLLYCEPEKTLPYDNMDPVVRIPSWITTKREARRNGANFMSI